ncbi:glutamine synthetase [Rhodohalobacter sp. SW132]|uniref:glutamine synthetase family protein n=1 Tax=Rhodohalobacter sp. SW132 TaxID=2293433 RepID=UPI000E273E34|nr:glutamine synthetase family protein [Rhodohalobacter sp. SW132]REL24088.1 glutamine synthetase [Rhodohalobacter sp. SW132]
MKYTKDEIAGLIESHPSNHIKVAVTDIDGVLRGKLISKKIFLKALHSGTGFCNVIFGWDVNDNVYEDSKVTGWHTGFPDSKVTIDPGTFRAIPWENDTPFFLADFNQSKELSGVCPRSLLKKVEKECHSMGYRPFFSSEYEWYNFSETPQSLSEKGGVNPTPFTPGMFGYSMLRASQQNDYFNALAEELSLFHVPVEGIHTETGDGVYEACIEYTTVLEAADRSVLFKNGVKEIASRFDIMPSFMAKWNNHLPGSGGHIHQSLWDEDGSKNLFYDEERKEKYSELMEHYIAGQLHCLPYILPLYAPTVNSYKRFVSGSWASTSVSWAVDNRTTALRVIASGPEAARLETRVPGADANPYLAIAAALASGLYGIKNRLTLNTPQTEGNEYSRDTSEQLPATLKDATEKMKASDLPAELFGKAFTEHFIYTREWEWKQFSQAVTDWELKRYFEII